MLQTDESPLANVTIRVKQKATRTNSDGYFLLTDVPAGNQLILFDGRSANYDDVHYPIFVLAWQLKANAANRLPFDSYLPVVDTAHTTQIDSHHETVHTTPLIPGLEIHIPKGTKIISVDGTPVTVISTTSLPGKGPFPMALLSRGQGVFTTQPGGSIANKAMTVIYNNEYSHPPGTRLHLFHYEPYTKGDWDLYGMGTVTPDGSQVIPDPGTGINTFFCGFGTGAGGHGCRSCGGSSGSGGGGGGGGGGGDDPYPTDGEPVDLGGGVYTTHNTDLAIPGLMPLVLSRTYKSSNPNIGPLGRGTFDSFDLRLYGTAFNPAPGDFIDFINTSDTGYRFVYQTNFPYHTYVCTNDIRFAGAKIVQITGTALPPNAGWNYYAIMKDGTVYAFDGWGSLWRVEDANHNVIAIQRTGGGGNIISVTQPSGRYLSFTYNGNNLISKVVDSAGRSVSYAYDASQRLIAVTNALGQVSQYTYDAAHNLTTNILRNGVAFVATTYNASGRAVSQTLADGATFALGYETNVAGVITRTVVTDPLNHVRTNDFNSYSARTNALDALGNRTALVLDSSNAVTKVIDALSRTNSFVYDAAGNITAITNAQAKVVKLTYEPAHNRLTSTVDPLARTNVFVYDGRGNLTSITNALGKVATITYNQFGQPTSVTDPLTSTHTFTYNESFDLVTITDPLGNTVRRLIDSAGRPYALIDSHGRVTRINYDALNRIVNIVDAVSGTVSFGYDAVGNLTNVLDALNHTISYVYDSMNRLTNRTDQLGRTEIYRYDKNGNVTNFVDRRGVSVNFLYDTLDRRTGIVYGAESNVKYFYDKVGRVTNINDSIAGNIALTYDSLDRLTQELNSLGTVNYSYNDVGLRTNMIVVGQSAVGYLYDPASRLTNVVQTALVGGSTSSSSLFYDDGGRRTKLTLPNGINVLYTYDTASRLTNITYQAAVTNKIDYAYDSVGNRVAQASLLAIYNLPSAVSTGTYNAANQQLSFGSYNVLYDLSGNVTNIINGTTTNRLFWSSRNQLTNMTGAAAASFLYDGLGRRKLRTVNGTAVNYLYDGLDAVVEKDAAGLVLARYFRGLGIDEPWQRGDISIVGEGGTTSGLRGWWKMNEGTGTSVADSSGNGNNGTLPNGGGWTSGIASNALDLDGVNDYVSIGDKATLEGNATWTFAGWVNPDQFFTSRDTWLFYKQNVLQWGFLSAASRQQTVNIGGGGNNSLQGAVTNSTQLSSNAWTHVTVTYTNSTVKFYVNGLLTDTLTKTYTMGSNNKAFSISTSSQSFDGKLDDMRYYNRALSDSEVPGIYGETSTNSHYLADALGSIVALTDTGKVIQTEYDYEPFGKSTSTGSPTTNPYTFTGREDDGTGLYYYRARYYHPALGRFVSEDPMGSPDGANAYQYVENSPTELIDPLGLYWMDTDRSTGKITVTVDKCEIVILIAHGSKKTPPAMRYLKCSAGAFIGCWPGLVNTDAAHNLGSAQRHQETMEVYRNLNPVIRDKRTQAAGDSGIVTDVEANYNQLLKDARTRAGGMAGNCCPHGVTISVIDLTKEFAPEPFSLRLK